MNSLIAEDTQLRLTTADMPNEAFAPTEAEGVYTAERLFRHRRHEYDLIVRMLGEGMSAISISRVAQCAEKTVAAVRQREASNLPAPDVKAAMGQRWANTFHLAVDIIQEIAEDPKRRKDVSFKDAGIVASIATQNQQLLSGGPTGRIEFIDRGGGEHNDLEGYLEKFRSAKVIDVDATTNPTTDAKEPAQLPAPQ